jgi:hypothetical protein
MSRQTDAPHDGGDKTRDQDDGKNRTEQVDRFVEEVDELVEDGDDDEPSLEDLAIEAGWKPKSQWKGDADEHVSAAEYMRRLAKSQKGLKKKIRDAEDELAAKDAEFDKRIKRLEGMNAEGRRREVSRIKAYYDGLLDEAIESGNKKAIREATAKRDEVIDDLQDQLEAGEDLPMSDDEFVETMVQNLPHPTVQKPFFAANDWLLDSEDEEACEAFAEIEEIVSTRVIEATQGKRKPTHAEFEAAFEAAERHLKRAYGHRLGDPDEEEDDEMDDEERAQARKRNGKGQFKPRRESEDRGADRGGRRRTPVLGAANRGRGRDLVSRLPPEALKAADDDIKAGLFADRAEYAKVYFQELGEKVD